MERAARVIARWKNASAQVAPEELARAAWRAAVGKKIAEHTVGLDLVRKHLIVRVEDDIWRRQLFSLRFQIVRNLRRILGEGIVEDLEFRIAPRRMGPAREENPRPSAIPTEAAAADEAESIADPILRMLYLRSRRRASA